MRVDSICLIPFILTFSIGCENLPVSSPEKFEPKKTPPISSVVIFGHPETGTVFTTYYRTQIIEKDTLENCFHYRLDSLLWRDGRKERVRKDFETSSQSFCVSTTTDTFYLNFKANPPASSYDQYKYILIDSLDIPLKTGTFRVYSYKNDSNDPKWDETLYFSNDIGFVYSHYPHFKKKYELIKHSSIDDLELLQIMDSLKVRSGELTEADINSRKKSS